MSSFYNLRSFFAAVPLSGAAVASCMERNKPEHKSKTMRPIMFDQWCIAQRAAATTRAPPGVPPAFFFFLLPLQPNDCGAHLSSMPETFYTHCKPSTATREMRSWRRNAASAARGWRVCALPPHPRLLPIQCPRGGGLIWICIRSSFFSCSSSAGLLIKSFPCVSLCWRILTKSYGWAFGRFSEPILHFITSSRRSHGTDACTGRL